MHIPELDEKIDMYHAITDRYVGTFKVDGYPDRIARNARGFQLDLHAEISLQASLVEAIFKLPTRAEIIEYVTQTIVTLEKWTPMPPLEPIPIPIKIEKVEMPLLVVPERIIEAEQKPLTVELIKIIQISKQGLIVSEAIHVILMSRDGRRFIHGVMKIISMSTDLDQTVTHNSILFLHDTAIRKDPYKQSEYYSSIIIEHSTEKPYSQPFMTGIIVFVTDDSELNVDLINPSFIYAELEKGLLLEISNPHIYTLLEEDRNDEIKVKARTLVTNVIFRQINYENNILSDEDLLVADVFFMNDRIIATQGGFIRFYYKFESDDLFYPTTHYFLLYDGDEFIGEALVYLKV